LSWRERGRQSFTRRRLIEVFGHGLRIFPPYAVVAAEANQPLMALRDFHFHSSMMGLFLKPMHVARL
jgi:hypothetical protein